MSRPLLLHTSALSPQEYEQYSPAIPSFSRAHEHVHGDSPQLLWEWLKHRLPDKVDKPTESQILSFFKQAPVTNERPPPPEQTILALLRYYSHSLTSKHLLRDHVFIATDPVELVRLAGDDDDHDSAASVHGQALSSQASSIQTAGKTGFIGGQASMGKGPPPPLPFKRHIAASSPAVISNPYDFPPASACSPSISPSTGSPVATTSSPNLPSGTSTNPFRSRTISSQSSPSTSTSAFTSFSTAHSTTPTSVDTLPRPQLPSSSPTITSVASPPLPPRPRGTSPSRPHQQLPPPRKLPSAGPSGHSRFPSTSSATLTAFVPPIPVRRSSVPASTSINSLNPNSTPPPPVPATAFTNSSFAIISSSNPSPTKAPKPPKRLPTTSSTSKLVNSTHIGPATKLRTGSDEPSSLLLSNPNLIGGGGRMSRSNSYSSSTSTDLGTIVGGSNSGSGAPVRGSTVTLGGKGGWTFEPVAASGGGGSGVVGGSGGGMGSSGKSSPARRSKALLLEEDGEDEAEGSGAADFDTTSVKTDPTPSKFSTGSGLNRSKTVGSKAPPLPPPKRRPQSMIFSPPTSTATNAQNPFEPTPTPSNRISPSPNSANSSNSTSLKTRTELERLLERSGNKSEEWISKAKEGGLGIVSRASGGAGLKGRGTGSGAERERLVSGSAARSGSFGSGIGRNGAQEDETRGVVGLGYGNLENDDEEEEHRGDSDEDEEKEDEEEYERVREQVIKERERDEVMESDGVGWNRLRSGST